MPQHTEAYTEICLRARTLARAGDAEAALQTYEEALRLDGDDADVHEAMAFLHFRVGRLDKAIEKFQQVLRLDPRRASAYVNMGAVYNKQENYTKAIEVLRRSIAIDKRSAEAFYNLGIAHRKLRQWSMAIPAYKEAIRLDPQMAEAYQNLGNVYLEMASHQQAISQFRKALELQPNFERARRGLDKAEAAYAALRKAENPFGRLVRLPPEGGGQQGVDDGALRVLSEEDREHDRQVLHQLTLEMQDESKAFVEMLKDRLAPALRSLSKTFADDAKAEFGDACDHFRQVLGEFAPRVKRLNKLTDHLRAHEIKIQQGSAKD